MDGLRHHKHFFKSLAVPSTLAFVQVRNIWYVSSSESLGEAWRDIFKP